MTRSARTFLKNNDGAVAATYALALVGLIVIGGVGFDYGRLMAMDSELQNGADEAALAGATQLDGKDGACGRAEAAAANLVTNTTRMATSANSVTLTVPGNLTTGTTCTSNATIKFWKDKEKAAAATSTADAKFVEVLVDVRTVQYAFTPLTSLITGSLQAGAMAGLGSSICKVPPIMLCSPDPLVAFNAAGRKGIGVVATGHAAGTTPASNDKGTNNTWAPGDFGFLQVGTAQDTTDTMKENRNKLLLKALAYANPPLDCTPVDGNRVSTGNPQGLYEAINTRFDIYDFNSGAGNTLGSCQTGDCPPASNVVKDVFNSDPTKNNACKLAKNGWELPAEGSEFKPVPKTGETAETPLDDNGTIQVMGLPRDNCHYTSYNSSGRCAGDRFGTGTWARADYFSKNHPSDYPANWQSITRYDTYLWELNNSKVPNPGGATGQRGSPVCFSGTATPDPSRRVLTVAVVKNCADLHGQSEAVEVDEWVDVFLVEPSMDAKQRWNAFKDAIYIEVIGPSKIAGGGGAITAQTVRRDVPYLVH